MRKSGWAVAAALGSLAVLLAGLLGIVPLIERVDPGSHSARAGQSLAAISGSFFYRPMRDHLPDRAEVQCWLRARPGQRGCRLHLQERQGKGGSPTCTELLRGHLACR